MNVKFNIYIITEESHFNEKKKTILVKVQNQNTYNGFETFEKAENWIIENGEKRIDYTILSNYRDL